VYGYAVTGEAFHSGYNFGVMDDSTYIDGASTSRTIKGIYHHDVGGSNSDDMAFSIDVASLGDTDTIWKDMTWDDTGGTPRTLTRGTEFNVYTASLNGSTHWRDLTTTYNFYDVDANTDFVLTTG